MRNAVPFTLTGSFRRLRHWLVVPVVVFGLSSAFGAEEGEESPSDLPLEDLGEEIVKGEATSEALWAMEERILVLDSYDLHERRQVRTVPEALKEVPGISVQKTSHGQGSPYIRGFTGFRTLLLIDGIRVNNSVFRSGPNQYWNTVDPWSVQALEVVKGAGGIVYGSDAIGGAVNAVTKRCGNYGEGFRWTRGARYRYASAEDSHVGRVESCISYDNAIGLYGGFSLRDFGDLEGGRDVGVQRRTGYEELDGDAKLTYFLNEDEKLVCAYQRVKLDNAWRTHKTVYGIPWEGTTVGNELKRVFDQERELAYVQYHAKELSWFLNSFSASFSYQRQSEDRHRVRTGKDTERMGFDVETLGAWMRLESESSIGTWTYGGEYYLDWVDSFKKKYDPVTGDLTSKAIQGAVADNSRYHLAGVYAQDRIPLIGDSLEGVAGARYTFARADAGRYKDPSSGRSASLNDSWDSLVGSGRLLWHFGEEQKKTVFAGVSQGFRTPNLSDLTRSCDARTNEFEVAAPGLDPEEYLCYEVGLRASCESYSGQFSYFYYDINDMILRTPTGNVDADGNLEVTKKNSGDGYVHGVELGGRWEFRRPFSAFGTFTWLDGEVETYPEAGSTEKEDEPISRLMPAVANIGLRWDSESRKHWVEGVVTIAGEANELSTRDANDTQRIPPGGTPGYAVLSLRSGWRVARNVTVSAAVENVTNEDYRIHGSGVNEPGTNVVLSLAVEF